MRKETGYQALDDRLSELAALERTAVEPSATDPAQQADATLAARLSRLSRLQAAALAVIIAVACLLITLTALRLISIPDNPPAPENVVLPPTEISGPPPATEVKPTGGPTSSSIVLPPEAFEHSAEFFGLDRPTNFLRQYAPADAAELTRWHYYIGGRRLDPPVVGSDGTVYMVSGGTLFALTSAGEFKWSWRADSGNISQPAVAPNGGVMLAGELGLVYALDKRGKLRWSFDAEGSCCGSPLVAPAGQVYVKTRTASRHELGYIYALSPGGRQRWRFDAPYQFDHRPLTLGPDGAVYDLNSDGLLLRADSSGRIAWQLEFGEGAKGPVFVPGAVIVSARAPEGREQYWQLSALSPQTGRELWHFGLPTQPSNAPLAGSDGTIYIECYHGLADNKRAPWRSGIWALSRSGQLLWQHDYLELSRLQLVGAHNGELDARVSDGGFKLDRDGAVVLGLPELDGWPTLISTGPDGTIFAEKDGELTALGE